MISKRSRENRAGCEIPDLELARRLAVDSLALLLRAAQYAQNTHRPAWDFAVALDELRVVGLSDCDLRWLACKGFVEHAIETSRREGDGRSFDPEPALHFDRRSSFILSPAGIELVEQILIPGDLAGAEADAQGVAASLGPQGATTPLWDAGLRELRVGLIVVKRYCVPAANQEIILTAFQEEDWPLHIDDPLPPAPELDPKRRLHSTIQCLNRNQKAPLVRFHGNGCGNGVRWELLAPRANGASDERPAAKNGG